MKPLDHSRRDFLESVAKLSAGLIVTKNLSIPLHSSPDIQVPRRAMGKTGLEVSYMGVGGYHLGIGKGSKRGE